VFVPFRLLLLLPGRRVQETKITNLQILVLYCYAPVKLEQKYSNANQQQQQPKRRGRSDDDYDAARRPRRCRRGGGTRNFLRRLVSVEYEPDPSCLGEDGGGGTSGFWNRARAQTSDDGGVRVRVAAMSAEESRRYFGRRQLARRGVQPVYVEVTNSDPRGCPLYLDVAGIDPNYYTPLEASAACHFWSTLGQLATALGPIAFLWLPLLLVVLPLKLPAARRANRRMDDYFCRQSFPRGLIESSANGNGKGNTAKGFVFTSLEEGTKNVKIRLLGVDRGNKRSTLEFDFAVPVPGISVDYEERTQKQRDVLSLYPPEEIVSIRSGEGGDGFRELRRRLENFPRATTDKSGTREGDPANLVVVGHFDNVLCAFGPRWDETEITSLATCYKTAKSFLFGTQYKYSPVSPLYMFGRPQDFALQRSRSSITRRLHLRLWLTRIRFDDKPVWIGQISRDIGVKLTTTSWSLTTHRVDPDVDDARDYLLSQLLESGYAEQIGLVGGVGESTANDPRVNLGNDPYLTNGKRGVVLLTPTKTQQPRLIKWD